MISLRTIKQLLFFGSIILAITAVTVIAIRFTSLDVPAFVSRSNADYASVIESASPALKGLFTVEKQASLPDGWRIITIANKETKDQLTAIIQDKAPDIKLARVVIPPTTKSYIRNTYFTDIPVPMTVITEAIK